MLLVTGQSSFSCTTFEKDKSLSNRESSYSLCTNTNSKPMNMTGIKSALHACK